MGLNSVLSCSCAGELQSPGCTVCCQVLPMYCQVPSICLGKSLLCLCFSRALISSAKSFVGACCFWTELCVVLLLCRRVTVAGLHCLLPSASNLSGEVTSVSAARCLLMHCQVPSICLGES